MTTDIVEQLVTWTGRRQSEFVLPPEPRSIRPVEVRAATRWRVHTADVRDPLVRQPVLATKAVPALWHGFQERIALSGWAIRRADFMWEERGSRRIALHYVKLARSVHRGSTLSVRTEVEAQRAFYAQALWNFRFLGAVHRQRDASTTRGELLAALELPRRLDDPDAALAERRFEIDESRLVKAPPVEPEALPRETRAGPADDWDPEHAGAGPEES
jgi:hypothetical protein